MEKFTFITELTDKEKYRLSLFIMLKSERIKRSVRMIFIPLVVVGIFVYTALFSNPYGQGEQSVTMVPFLFPLLFLVIIFVGPLIVIKVQKIRPTTYHFDSWGMTVTANATTQNVPWQDLLEYTETGNFILLRQNSQELFTHIIRKSSFSGNDELRAFIDFLSQQRLKRK